MPQQCVEANIRGATSGVFPVVAAVRRLLGRTGSLLLRWWERIDGRHRLGHLDDRMLRDIGLCRGEAERERRKYFWEA